MHLGRLLALFLLLAVPRPAAAGFPGEVLRSAGRAVSSPARISKADLPAIGALAGGGLVLYSLDGQIRHAFHRSRSKLNDDISEQAEKLGNGGYDAALVAAYGGLGLLMKDAYMQDTALLAAESFLAANAAGTLLKYSVGRGRPYAEDGKRRFTPFRFKTARTSFPSGHTVSAFSVASVFAARSGSRAVKVLAYTLASSVALQRVYADKHWASDTLAGAAIGTAVGRWVSAKKDGKVPTSALVLPVYTHAYAGVAGVISF